MNQLLNIFSSAADNVFLKHNGICITYKEYLISSAALAQILAEKSKNPTVCILADDTVLYFYCFMAVLLCAGSVVPVDAEKTAEEIDEIINIVNPDCIITDKQTIKHSATIINKEDLILNRSYSECLDKLSTVDTEREYLITFTSGTTAEPKGVVHSFGNLLRSAYSLGNMFNFDCGSVFYHNFPVSYMAGILNQFIVPMVFGSQVAIGNRFNVQQALHFWDKPIENKANVFWMSPTILRLLLSVDRGETGKTYCKDNAVTIIAATAPLPVSLRKDFETAYKVPVYESFGLTETLFNATNHPGKPVCNGCAGYVLPGVHITIEADEEMLIRCEWMFLRYFHENNTGDAGRAFQTGDLAKIEDNRLFITGRKKDLIIKGGMNISPGKIESVLDQIITINEFCVIGLPDSVLGEKIVLVYVNPEVLNKETEKEVNRILITRLGKNYIIDSFIKVEALPKNKNGKVDKRALKETYFRSDN